MNEQFLKDLISNNCPTTRHEDDLTLHTIDLHCNTIWAIVRSTEDGPEIISYKLQGMRTDAEMYDMMMGEYE